MERQPWELSLPENEPVRSAPPHLNRRDYELWEWGYRNGATEAQKEMVRYGLGVCSDHHPPSFKVPRFGCGGCLAVFEKWAEVT